MDDQQKCDNYKPSVNSRGDCIWEVFEILDDSVCRNPWHGVARDVVLKWTKGEKND